MGPRVKEGVCVGYGRQSHSYVVFSQNNVGLYRSMQRMTLSTRWSADKVQAVNISVEDANARPGGFHARSVPFTDRETAEPPEVAKGRTARRLELRQADFDPAMQGYGWSENCPKCDKARAWGWRASANQQHSEACRRRLESELAKTAKGRARLENAKERLDTWAAKRGEDIIGQRQSEQPEGEIEIPHRDSPPQFLPDDLSGTGGGSYGGGTGAGGARDAGEAGGAGASARPAHTGGDDTGAQPRGREPARAADDGESDDGQPFDGRLEHGNEVPMTPESMDYSQPSPMRLSPMAVDFIKAYDEDINLIQEIDDEDGQAISAHLEILNIISKLGGDTRKYRRERAKQMNRILSEVYSTARVTRAAELLPRLRISPGCALDVTGVDDEGNSWDFTKVEMCEKALRLIDEQKPYMLVGSPPCTNVCAWRHLNAAKHGWSKEEIKRREEAADVHLQFVYKLYRIQIDQGRYFLHEHPDGAGSWKNPYILDLWNHESVERVTGDQCQYGQHDGKGNPVKKPTGWLSNSKHVLRALGRRCSGTGGSCSRPRGGRHAHAEGRVARQAAVYPFKLCEAILTGMYKQLEHDGRVHKNTVGVQAIFEEDMEQAVYVDVHSGEVLTLEDHPELEAIYKLHEYQREVYVDSVTGQPLDEGLVRAARAKEMDYFKSKEVWEKRDRHEAFDKTG